MKKLFAPLLLLIIINFSSCKKCITCRLYNPDDYCATCIITGAPAEVVCQSDLGGAGTLEEFVDYYEDANPGMNCTISKGATLKEEKVCHTSGNTVSQNTAITARYILEGDGYVCE